MELAFESQCIRTICENEARARIDLGLEVAEALKHRLADMRAATSIYDLVAGKPRLSGTQDQQLVVDLCDSHRVVLEANHPDNPTMETGRLDWARISRIKVLRIESDYD